MFLAGARAGGLPVAGLLVFFLLPLFGCAGIFSDSSPGRPVPERLHIDDVPFYAQGEYQCGPAALAMLLSWSGGAVSPAGLTSQVYSPALKGSLQPALIAASRRHGRLAYPIAGSAALLAELAAGHPVLILQNLGLSWFPRWHYAVVIGYDRGDNRVILHSGRDAALSMSGRLFANTWARSGSWGLLVLPPERLPATATADSFLAAVVGLEQAGQWQAAALAYGAAAERWPESFFAWMGLGNSHHALGESEEAERAFRRALELQSGNGPALNNLALVLVAAGRRQEALVVIGQAVALGGEFREEILITQREILAGGEAGFGETTPDPSE